MLTRVTRMRNSKKLLTGGAVVLVISLLAFIVLYLANNYTITVGKKVPTMDVVYTDTSVEEEKTGKWELSNQDTVVRNIDLIPAGIGQALALDSEIAGSLQDDFFKVGWFESNIQMEAKNGCYNTGITSQFRWICRTGADILEMSYCDTDCADAGYVYKVIKTPIGVHILASYEEINSSFVGDDGTLYDDFPTAYYVKSKYKKYTTFLNTSAYDVSGYDSENHSNILQVKIMDGVLVYRSIALVDEGQFKAVHQISDSEFIVEYYLITGQEKTLVDSIRFSDTWKPMDGIRLESKLEGGSLTDKPVTPEIPAE